MSDVLGSSGVVHAADSDWFDRRVFVQRGIALGAGLAAAGTLLRYGASAQEEAATPAAASGSATPAIVAAADAFLDTLDDAGRAAVVFDWSDTEQKQRWSNLPDGGFERAGVMWGNLATEQQSAWLDVLKATLSSEGYERVLAAWYADDQLGGGGGNGGPGGGMSYGSAYYWMAFVGEPSDTDPWQLQFGGHHITINATIAGADIAMTPSFVGAQPATYTDANGNTIRPLGDITDAAFALVNALDDDRKAVAILGDTSIDLVLGPGQDGKTIQPEGLAGGEMTEDQRGLLLDLIGHYAAFAAGDTATARMDELAADLAETYFVWYGPTSEGSAAYFRVSGPTIVIEYSPQEMGGDPADHIHGIYRDPTNDYGARFTS